MDVHRLLTALEPCEPPFKRLSSSHLLRVHAVPDDPRVSDFVRQVRHPRRHEVQDHGVRRYPPPVQLRDLPPGQNPTPFVGARPARNVSASSNAREISIVPA